MRIHFRPLPGLTIATAFAFAITLALGTWQIHRLQWKEGLIALADANYSAPAVSLKQAQNLGDAAQFRHVSLEGHFLHVKEVTMFSTRDGRPVYHVITPFVVRNGPTVLVDRGIVPAQMQNPETREAGQIKGEISFNGVWRKAGSPGSFTPVPDLVRHVWYVRDVDGIASAMGLKVLRGVVIEAGPAPNPGGWPLGGQTRVEFRNAHLGYAITWFLLACVLLAVYVAYHLSRGRISIARQ